MKRSIYIAKTFFNALLVKKLANPKSEISEEEFNMLKYFISKCR